MSAECPYNIHESRSSSRIPLNSLIRANLRVSSNCFLFQRIPLLGPFYLPLEVGSLPYGFHVLLKLSVALKRVFERSELVIS